MIRSTMQRVPLSLNHLLERAGQLLPANPRSSAGCPTSRSPHRFADFYRRSRALASALLAAGLKKGDRVATLCWNHHAHLECYFGIPAAGGVMHTLNLRLAPGRHRLDREPRAGPVPHRRRHPAAALRAVQAASAVREGDRRARSRGKPRAAPASSSYEASSPARRRSSTTSPHDENDPVAMCYTSGTTGRPKGVVYSHRSTVIHTLVANQPDHWGLSANDERDARDADVPRQLLGHAVRLRDDGHQDGVPGPAPAPRGPARPDGAGAADATCSACRRSGSACCSCSTREPGPLQAAAGHAHAGRRRGDARGADPRLRAARRGGHATAGA